ncbi:bifunctional GNAT family N-acetyltransferase/carbon-nitrogen hydrolase family protein [Botrimarina mediterranea]|uniref:(R)-stereoselective amidase n=1 Tax=Botrimarina mediterranea TaxID=2528022 RepID=A0A518KDA8_9BACT|nr:bifunctional GNAT family N-acetyltransferase/carbon-nitrogen hydrolase family protein [Botrimarina mediterranea]QDV75776.1 (R)-stereoselective amidase [Botrimarina mediterranea]QDV80373.1 (R)-stereoselective amidase [Planctomycetes bacterium K2D]
MADDQSVEGLDFGDAGDPVRIRRWEESDIPALVAVQRECYPGMAEETYMDERKLRMQLAAFPEGQFLAEIDGRIVGYASSLIVILDDESPWHSYDEITGVGTFGTHDPAGDTLYGADIAVVPDWRGKGLAARLYKRRKALLTRFNLRRMVAGGRLPGYSEHAKRLKPIQYVEAVKQGQLRDQALSAHLKAGYTVRGIHYGYLRDGESMNYATFLEMPNPEFDPARRLIAGAPIRRPVRKIRVCACQYQLRPLTDWAQFEMQVEFFADAAKEFHCHFLLLPELFTVQLFTLLPSDIDTHEAVREIAKMHDQYVELCKRMAVKHGLYFIAGSHPVIDEEGDLLNVAHLFTPSGDVYTQPKLHMTPSERNYYDMQPGDVLRVFDTPLGRIGILVCYDIEFPELSRLLMKQGVEVLFVPFATTERKGYHRVRHCAQARAIENVIYVVLAGCVGNLPQVNSFLITYGQAAVCTPCDFSFPKDGVLAEGEPNNESVCIAELDLNDLAIQRDIGTVRPLQDRRDDLYQVSSTMRIETIQVR